MWHFNCCSIKENDIHKYKHLYIDTFSDSMTSMYNLLTDTALSNIHLLESLKLLYFNHCDFDVLYIEQILNLLFYL
jgi:CMP-2-keto-3-deoxyoctulosonic acid synthetase